MKITHDKYAKMQNLVILHLQDVEHRTSKGVDRDELIDWYLESVEDELQSVEDLDYEKELFVKVLRKLVKVRRYSQTTFHC
jgi:DNA replication licensing factor MCM6